MKWIVYCTTNIVNKKIYYGVHKTLDPDVFDGYLGCGTRVNNPSSYMRARTPFQAAVKKYGPSKFIRSVVKVFECGKDAYKLEEEIVNADFLKRKDVYNVRLGGDCGHMLNITYQFDFNGNLIKTWDCLQDIADFYYTSESAICTAVKCKSTYQGFLWSYSNKINVEEYNIYTGGTTTYKYDSSGNFVEDYDSMVIAAKSNNILLQQVQRAVNGGYIANGNYYATSLYENYKGKQKISIKGKTVYAYNLDGTFVKALNTSKELLEFLNSSHLNAITSAMRMEKPYHGYQLSLEKVERMNAVIDRKNIKKEIGRYSLTGDLLQTYDSISNAEKEYGSGVRKVLKGQQKHCHNFVFKYI